MENKILITGSQGFIGQHLYNKLSPENYVMVSTHQYRDLVCEKIHGKYDLVYNLAGYNGGIQFNSNKEKIFYENTMMGLNTIHHLANNDTKKIVSMVASCAYPTGLDYLSEEDFFNGPIHETVEGHGYAKRNIQLISKYISKETECLAVCACPTTVYGPLNHLNPHRTKVLESIIIKLLSAKKQNLPEVTFFGSGKPLREFIYVEDLVGLLIKTMLYYTDSNIPINLGSGQEFTIKHLVEQINNIIKYSGKILWDKTKPDGEFRKRLDVRKMNKLFGNITFTPFEIGLHKTVNWYEEQLCKKLES